VRLLCSDGAARVGADHYRTVRPFLAVSGGGLIALSTLWGKRGWWYESWISDEAGERYRVPASACPRIPAAFLAEEQRVLGAQFSDQEDMCQVGDAGASLFSHDVLTASMTSQVQPLFAATA